MRILLAILLITLCGLSDPVSAGSPRACAQVSALLDGAVRPLLANLAGMEPDATQLGTQLRDCLSSRNICAVVHNSGGAKATLVAGDVTADLPVQYLAVQDKSSVIFLVRSVPRVRNDSNQYCLVSESSADTTSVQRWDVYGWVIAPNASETLPLQREVLDGKAASDPRSLRSLAAALWYFAQRMSGRPTP